MPNDATSQKQELAEEFTEGKWASEKKNEDKKKWKWISKRNLN